MAIKAVIQNSILSGGADLAVSPGADVEIRTPAGGLASLWTDRAGTIGESNPFTADANGFFRIYATPGRYQITATVGAEVQVFEDVIAQASAEPPQIIDFIRSTLTAGQTRSSVAAPTVVTLDGTNEIDHQSRGSLTLNASDITAAALGSEYPGFLDIDYSLVFNLKDGASQAATGDILQAFGGINVDGVADSPALSALVCHAITPAGVGNAFAINGHAVVELDGTAAVVIELMAGIGDRSSGTLQIDLSDDSYIMVRRITEPAD